VQTMQQQPGHIDQSVNDTGWEIEFMLMHIVRDEAVFQMAVSELTPEMLSKPSEVPYQHIWRAILEHYQEYSVCPKYETLAMRALAAIEQDPIARVDPEIGAMMLKRSEWLLEWMYDTTINPPDSIEPAPAKDILRNLLISRGPEDELRRAIENSVGNRVINLPELVANAKQRIENIEAMGKTVDDSSFPDSFAQAAKPKWPTGVEFIDRVMDGGSEPGDCNVLLGPTGGGKSTLAMQMATSTARLQSQLAQRGVDGEPGLVVFVSYEDSLRMMRIRAASFAARVLKNHLRDLRSDDLLSTVGNLHPYEQSMYASEQQTSEMLGEQERLEMVKPWIKKHMVMVDYHDPKNGGRGHVTEVRQKLTAVQQERGMPIKMVVLDWAGNLVSNYLQGVDGSIEGSKMSLELQNLVNRAKHEIAAPFNTCVWIPHQLTGKSCKAAPAHFPHHADAQWCSMFSDHAWYAFVIGTKDLEHNVCQFGATKTRHGETLPPTILRIDGAMCRMTDVSQHFEVDEVTRRLTPKSEASRFHSNLGSQQASVDMS